MIPTNPQYAYRFLLGIPSKKRTRYKHSNLALISDTPENALIEFSKKKNFSLSLGLRVVQEITQLDIKYNLIIFMKTSLFKNEWCEKN